MKIKIDEGVCGIASPCEKNKANLNNAKIEIKNSTSNKIIKTVLFGFDFASLNDLINKDSLVTVDFSWMFFCFI